MPAGGAGDARGGSFPEAVEDMRVDENPVLLLMVVLAFTPPFGLTVFNPLAGLPPNVASVKDIQRLRGILTRFVPWWMWG